jgi:large subunit ribosomal protein L22
MKITAQLNNLRIAPRKVRLVAGVIRGKDAMMARQQLNFLTKRSSGPLAKLLESALQNAEHNFGLLKENLFIKDVIVNEGMKLKRFMPRAMGQAGSIQKKTSRITVVLEEKVPGLKANKKEAALHRHGASEDSAEEHRSVKSKEKPDFEAKSDINKKGVFDNVKNVGRKLFRRKSV